MIKTFQQENYGSKKIMGLKKFALQCFMYHAWLLN